MAADHLQNFSLVFHLKDHILMKRWKNMEVHEQPLSIQKPKPWYPKTQP